MELEEIEKATALYEAAFGKRAAQDIMYRAINRKGDITLLGGPSIQCPFKNTRFIRGRYGKLISWEKDPFHFHIQTSWFVNLSEREQRNVELNFGDIAQATPTSIIELDLEHGIEKEYRLIQQLFVDQRDTIKGPKAFMFHVALRHPKGGFDKLLLPYLNDMLGTNVSLYNVGIIRNGNEDTRGREYNLCGTSGEYSIKILSYADRGLMAAVLIQYGEKPSYQDNTKS